MPIFESIAAGVGSSLLGGLLGGGQSQSPEMVTMPFKPVTSTGGVGTVGFKGGKLDMSLNPQLQALQNQAYGQAGAFLNDPSILGLGQQAIGQSGQALGALGAFDPTQATADKYAAMEAIMAPGRQRELAALDAQLLRQGRLGSTGGAVQQAAQQQAFEQARMQNYMTAEQLAQQQQQHLYGLGSGLGAFGVQMQGAPTGLAASALGLGMAPSEFQLQQAQLLPMFQPQVAGTYTPAPSPGSMLGAGLLQGGAGLISGGIRDYVNPPSLREQNKTGAFL